MQMTVRVVGLTQEARCARVRNENDVAAGGRLSGGCRRGPRYTACVSPTEAHAHAWRGPSPPRHSHSQYFSRMNSTMELYMRAPWGRKKQEPGERGWKKKSSCGQAGGWEGRGYAKVDGFGCSGQEAAGPDNLACSPCRVTDLSASRLGLQPSASQLHAKPLAPHTCCMPLASQRHSISSHAHLLRADVAVVPLLGLLHAVLVLFQLLVVGEGDGVHALRRQRTSQGGLSRVEHQAGRSGRQHVVAVVTAPRP